VIKIKVDIIGGSLGGLSTAISLKQHDDSIDVFVHEKNKIIGYNHEGRKCGEAFIWREECVKWKPIGKSIFNNITKVETVVGQKSYVLRDDCFMLNKQEYICQLARQAERLGVMITTDDMIKSVDELDGDYIVDASGCPSVIRRELDLIRNTAGIAYQQTLEDCNKFVSNTVQVILTDYFPGYFWIFPRNPDKKEVNLGIGFPRKAKYQLKINLEKFKEKQGIEGKVNYTLGGLVPVGLQKPLQHENILFVGDAGVGTFPLSGEGIYRALISGDIAGYCLATGHPKWYTKKIYQRFIKWDVEGKTFLRMASVLNKIGMRSVFALYHLYLDFWYSHQ
jgi:flavin-dependent dehydrogenase